MLKRVVASVSALSGIVFAVWCMLSEPRLEVFAALALALYVLRLIRPRFSWSSALSSGSEFCNRHDKALLALILGTGIALRLLSVFFLADDHFNVSALCSDWAILWNYGVELANGTWPLNKSWTTTVLYAGVIRIFGQNLVAAWVVNNLAYLLTAVLAYKSAASLWGKFSGAVAMGFIWLSPVFLFHAFRPATEHLYILFVMASVYCGINCYLGKRFTLNAIGTVLAAWLAIWTRGEGILSLVVILGWLLMLLVLDGRIKQAFHYLAIALTLNAIFAVIGMQINQRTDGSKTVFCSNDNYWPRLFGANSKTVGGWNLEDKVIIYNQYLNDHPECGWEPLKPGEVPSRFSAKCPEEVAPYIEREISNRWKAMGLFGAAKHIFKKERVWRSNCRWMCPVRLPECADYAFVVLPTIGLIGCIVWLMHILFVNRTSSDYIALSLVWLLIGNACILALTEVADRYTIMVHLIFGVFAVAGLSKLLEKN